MRCSTAGRVVVAIAASTMAASFLAWNEWTEDHDAASTALVGGAWFVGLSLMFAGAQCGGSCCCRGGRARKARRPRPENPYREDPPDV